MHAPLACLHPLTCTHSALSAWRPCVCPALPDPPTQLSAPLSPAGINPRPDHHPAGCPHPSSQPHGSFPRQRQHSLPLWPAGQAAAELALTPGARLPGPSECINPTQHCYPCLVPLRCLILQPLCTPLYCSLAADMRDPAPHPESLGRPLLSPPPLPVAAVNNFVTHGWGHHN